MIGHRHLELPFGQADVVAVHGGLAWLRSSLGRVIVGVDLASAAVAHQLAVGRQHGVDPRVHIVGGTLAAGADRGEVVCIDVVTGATMWRHQAVLHGAAPGAFVMTARRPGGDTIVAIGADGRERVLVAASPDRARATGVVVSGGRAWTMAGDQLLGVPVGGDEPPFVARIDGGGRLVPWRDGVLLATTVELPAGPRARLVMPDLVNGGLREVGSVEGCGAEASMAAAQDVLVAVDPGDSGETWDCIVTLLAGRAAPLRLAVPVRARPVSNGEVVCVAQDGALAVLGRRGDALSCVRLPLGRPTQPEIGVGDGVACVVAGTRLFVVDLGALDQVAGVADLDGVYAPVIRGGFADPVPARVVFAGPSYVSVDHPRFGRVNLHRSPGSPTVARNDHVLLDSVIETTPGTWKVDAWRKPGDPAPPGRSPAAPLVLAAAAMPPRDAIAPPPRTHLDALRRSSERLAFSIPPLLERLVGESDRDPLFRRWLDHIGIIVDVAENPLDAPASGIVLIAMASTAGGDIHALRLDPKTHAPGDPLPVVDQWHETGEVSLRAEDFEGYVADLLHEEREEAPEVVALILDRLGLARDFPRPSISRRS